MNEITNGWVVVTQNHGFTGRAFIVSSTFAPTKGISMKLFADDSGFPWKYWYRKFNYRCVRAQNIITVLPGKEGK